MLVIAQHLEQQSNVNVKDPRGTETNIIEKTNKSFEQEPLKGQVQVQVGGKSGKCIQCNYTYSGPSSLRVHLITHSGEKKNKCNQCDYASSGAGDLKKHLKIHSGEKPNKCNQSVKKTQLGKINQAGAFHRIYELVLSISIFHSCLV